MEFRNHKDVAKTLDCVVSFAAMYSPGQKGAVEGANKVLMEFFPK